MKRNLVLPLIVGLLLIGGCSAGPSKGIVGKWTTTVQPTATTSRAAEVEFLSDGTWAADGVVGGQYTLDGDKFTMIRQQSQGVDKPPVTETLVFQVTWETNDKFRWTPLSPSGAAMEFTRKP